MHRVITARRVTISTSKLPEYHAPQSHRPATRSQPAIHAVEPMRRKPTHCVGHARITPEAGSVEALLDLGQTLGHQGLQLVEVPGREAELPQRVVERGGRIVVRTGAHGLRRPRRPGTRRGRSRRRPVGAGRARGCRARASRATPRTGRSGRRARRGRSRGPRLPRRSGSHPVAGPARARRAGTGRGSGPSRACRRRGATPQLPSRRADGSRPSVPAAPPRGTRRPSAATARLRSARTAGSAPSRVRRTLSPSVRASTGLAPSRITASRTVLISLRLELHEEFADRSSEAVRASSNCTISTTCPSSGVPSHTSAARRVLLVGSGSSWDAARAISSRSITLVASAGIAAGQAVRARDPARITPYRRSESTNAAWPRW